MEVLEARRNDVLVLALKAMTLLEQSTKQVLSRLSKRPRSARHPVKRELLRRLVGIGDLQLLPRVPRLV